MLTCGGICTLGSLLVRVTESAPLGAGAVSLTVPIALAPPITPPAGTVIVAMHAADAGLTVMLADTRLQFAVEAEIAAGVAVETLLVLTMKSAEVCPAATLTTSGTWMLALLLWRINARPPAGAGAVRWTVPIKVLPAFTAAADKLREAMHAGPDGLRVTPTDALPHAPLEAEIVA